MPPENPRDIMRKQLDQFGELHREIHKTFLHRSNSETQYTNWKQACEKFHAFKSIIEVFENHEKLAKLRKGDSESLESAIIFLEIDAYVFGSGYAKARIIRCIKNLPFSESQRTRLQAVCKDVIIKFYRPEFRHFCRLAAAVQTPAFISSIQVLAIDPDEDIRIRASRVLTYLAKHHPLPPHNQSPE